MPREASGVDAFEALRTRERAIRDRGLEHLDSWLMRFEAEATRRGTEVRWAETRGGHPRPGARDLRANTA